MSRRQFCTTAAAGVLTACAKLPRRSNRPTMFIIHGYGATINNHWFGWLQTQLEQRGIAAVRVPMPDSTQPDFDRWQAALATHLGTPDAQTFYVAHSLGTISLLHYLTAARPRKIGGLVLVSAFGKRIPTLHEINGFNIDAYVDRCRIDFAAIARMAGNRIELISADDDTIVPVENTRYVAKELNGYLHIRATGGHFLDRDGFTQFPPVLESVERIVQMLQE